MTMPAIRPIRNTDPMFYRLMGPFLSRRAIVKEVGHPIWDDDAKEWFILRRQGQMLGFAAMTITPPQAWISSVYVLPDHRRRGVFRQLLGEMLRTLPDTVTHVYAVATVMSRAHFLASGFVVKRKQSDRFWSVEKIRA